MGLANVSEHQHFGNCIMPPVLRQERLETVLTGVLTGELLNNTVPYQMSFAFWALEV